MTPENSVESPLASDELVTTANTSKESSINWRAVLMSVLLIFLLATWGYIIWDKSRTKEIIQQKETQYAAVVSEKDTLQNLFEEATMRYDLLKTSSIKKDSLINIKDKEIADKKLRIQSLLSKENATNEELKEAKLLLASLNTDIEGYKAQVETLKGEKIKLTEEKQVVTQQRDKVIRSLDSVSTVVKQKDDMIDVGSTLHASNFNLTGISEKKNGREKETTTAKHVDKLRISFDIDENRICISGSKELYIAITTPNGKVVVEADLESGKFTTRDGEDKTFTKRLQINYIQGQKQSVSFDWKQSDTFIIGDYKIEVYNNGFKIGEGIIHLKKGGLFS